MTDIKTKTSEEPEQFEERPFGFKTLKPTELAWLAALLQAEATFTSDKRARSKSDDPNYTPPPAIPIVKLEMVEKDLMEYVSGLVDQKVIRQKRRTTAKKEVYRITIQARKKTENLLRAIIPYIVGEKSRSKILKLLEVCDTYNKWLAEGGKSNAAKLAAHVKKQKKQQRKPTNPD